RGTGMWAAIGIVGALFRRAATGKGCIVDASLFETALGWMTTHAATYQASGVLPRRAGSGTTGIVPYRGYATADGFLVVAAANDKLFGLFAGVLGHKEWVEDTRFRSNPDRVANQDELYALIEPIMATAPTAQWVGLLEEVGVPCAPLKNVDEGLAPPPQDGHGLLHHERDQ